MLDNTRSGFVETMGLHAETVRNLEAQASRILVQEREMKTMRDEVPRILEDSRNFVSRTEAEQNEARSKLLLEVESLHAKQQSIVSFVESVPATVSALQAQLNVVTDWFRDTSGRPGDAEGRRSRGAGPELRAQLARA